jgi:hypothetical protein
MWVAETPEEKVRQKWIRAMIGPLGYPKGLLAVEKQVGFRRFDLLCYKVDGESLRPLLLVECKAKAARDAMAQALGYNDLLAAPFIALIQGDEVQTFWKEGNHFKTVPFLPTYASIVAV